MSVLLVARWTLLEARRRRLLLAGMILSAAFVALFGVGFVLFYNGVKGSIASSAGQPAFGFELGGGQAQLAAMATGPLMLGLYGVQLIAAVLALFLGVASVSPEIDSGALHSVLTRPLSRLEYLAGRFLALAALLSGYVVVMVGSLLLIANVVAGFQPGSVVGVIGFMILEVVILLAVSVLGSTVLPTLANGVVMLALFGLAWLGGILEFLGNARVIEGDTLLNIGTAVSLLLPSDAVWRAASYHVMPTGLLVGASLVEQDGEGMPFVSTIPIAGPMLAWAIAYPAACILLALASFRRRDL